MRLITFFLLCACMQFSVAESQIYKNVKPDGSIEFSDTPQAGAEAITLDPLPTVRLLEGGGSALADSPLYSASMSIYKEVRIGSPEHNATIPVGAAGSFDLSVIIKPQLAASHTIQLVVNGEPFGQPTQKTEFQFSNIDRGSHIISANIVDGSGKTLASTSDITVHVKRNSILLKSAGR